MSRIRKHIEKPSSIVIRQYNDNVCNAYNSEVVKTVESKSNTVNSVLADVVEDETCQKCWCGHLPVVVGENANNNAIASARTVNGNNAVSNANDNWAPRFALKKNLSEDPTRHVQQGQILTEKVTDYGFEDVMELLQCEYGEPDLDSTSESNAKTLNSPIWKELKKANQKRHLKNLKKFITNREIVEYSVDHCLKKASVSPQKEKALEIRDDIVERIIKELTDETYVVGECTRRTIKKRGKDGKDRNANIFPIYDRCVQNVIHTVIKQKCRNILLRNVYSGVEGRSTTSNDRRFCLFNRIHDFCCKHPNAWVVTTDIKHFYESLDSRRVCEVFSNIVKDRYVFKILCDTFLSLPTLPIGGTLSQMSAMLVINDCDREILRRFKPKFYAIFGDNRLAGDEDKLKLIKIKEYQDIYYYSRLGLTLKEDYSYHKVSDGFRFCKTDFKVGHKHIRSDLRHRTVRAKMKGQQHYAGYKGFLLKTDSRRLRSLIENPLDFQLMRKHIYYDKNRYNDLKNMADSDNIKSVEKSTPLTYTSKTKDLHGKKQHLTDFVGKWIIIGKFTLMKTKHGDDGNDYYQFQIYLPVVKENGKKGFETYISWNSSGDIRYFFNRIKQGVLEKPKNGLVKVCKDGNTIYFDGYRDYNNDLGEKEVEAMELDIDFSIFEENGK